MEKIKAIENYEYVCFCCLKEKPIQKYSVYGRGYGSDFDNNNTHLQLCNDCKPPIIEDWFNETPSVDEYIEKYNNEDKICSFINTLPLQGQELFWNRCAHGACADSMESQDWIDDKLGILPDEVYENDYMMYSPRQFKAYEERFPTCEHPVNKVYSDGSKSCYCPFGASGNYNQEVDRNVSTECFGCEKYKVRQTPIKEMDSETYNNYEMYIRGKAVAHLFE
ncbi:hypothetical protein [Cytobacillus praedii]|uniref:Uncharacterized protein n=1 Tax=Cytobacillus praedii TaxID=1742358 RepID=A0A4R1ALI9_9BACI|nr:hypothetical protein [Cytobacillus praedii]TCJ00424.1 hypothetical protein E0Y62_26890 [Cytobacillus praedii]